MAEKSVLCSSCQMRPAHRVWESGRGKCGDCYALDPSEPKGSPQRTPRTQKLGAELEEIRRRVEDEKRGGEGSGGAAPVAPGPLAGAEPNKEAAMPKLNPKREAILADARARKFTCKELAAKHGVTYASVYAICCTAKVKLPKRSGVQALRSPAANSVQARAQGKVKKWKGEKGKEAEPRALALRGRSPVAEGLRALAHAQAESLSHLTLPFTPAVSQALWRGLPLATQHEILSAVLTPLVTSD